MKTWKQPVLLPKLSKKVHRNSPYGLFEVREATDSEARKTTDWPRSHGFVNLYRNGERIAGCGVNYAAQYKLEMPKLKLTVKQKALVKKITVDQRYAWLHSLYLARLQAGIDV